MISAVLRKFALVAAFAPFCARAENVVVGYVEGEYVAIAPVDVARISRETVRRGDVLKAGEPIAQLEFDAARIASRNAEAALAQAQSDLANPQKGRRPEEIAALEATARADARTGRSRGAAAAADPRARALQPRRQVTHFLRVVRAITLKGANFDDIGREFIWLCLYVPLSATLALLRFRRTLD
jgi:multidrug resistance efflux pump